MRHSTMRRVRISVLAAALISVASAPTSADVIHWHLPGVVDGSFECFNPDPENPCEAAGDNEFLQQFFPVGTHIDFDLTVDTQDFCPSPNVGSYQARLVVTINGVTARGGGAFEKPDNLGCIFDDPVGDTHVIAGVEWFGDFLFQAVEMFFSLSPGDDLPTVLPDGKFYLERGLFVRGLGGLTEPSSVVPEPTTALLVLGGLAAATAVRRRRR
jgi:PEP-CTERM motif